MHRESVEPPSRLLAACMVAAPLLAFVASLIGYQGTEGIMGELVFISLHAERQLTSNVLWMAASFLFIPTALGLLALVPDRLYRWGLVGTALLFLGGFAHGNVVSYSMVQIPLLESTLDQEAVSTFIATTMYDHRAFFAVLVPFLAFYLGLLVFAIVLWRGDVAPLWVSVLVVIALVAGLAWDHPAKNELMMGLLTIALGFLASKLWLPQEKIA